MVRSPIQIQRDLISDIEMLAAAMSASLTLGQSLALLSKRGSSSWRLQFCKLSEAIDRVGLLAATTLAKQGAGSASFDVLMELLAIDARFGDSNLSKTLNGFAVRLRKRLSIRLQVIERLNAILAVGKIALVAPWLVVVVISSRPENLTAFMNPPGFAALCAGLAVCIIAWLMMRRISKLTEPDRLLSL